MYQVLYRKWRPQKFADVSGQPQVTVTLKNELQAGRIAHAYLFTGSRGTGKTTCAKILSKAVNCLHPVDGDPCGECENCKGIDNGSVMDVVEIDAASNNGVDSIRTLREESSFTPAAAKYRVYIIDEVHMLSTGAFNALLKTLEEPPAHVIFILATTEVHKLPATILSRCQRFDFRRISPDDTADRLCYVAEQEGATLDREAALLIARISDGALRDALSLLDQCMGRSKEITVPVVNETAGLAGNDHLFALADAVKQQDAASVLAAIDSLYAASKDMARLCEELVAHYRNIMLIKTMRGAQNLIVLTKDEFDRLSQQAEKYSLPEVLHCMDTLQSAMERMFRGGSRRTEMEMALLKLCSPELDNTTAAISRRLDALERQLRSFSVSPAQAQSEPATEQKPEPQEKPAKRRTPPSQEPERPAPSAPESAVPAESASPALQDMAAIQSNAKPLACWPEILRVLKDYSQTIASAFNGSTAYESGDYVLIDAPNAMAFELLKRSAQRDKMRVVIKEVTGRVYKLGPYKRKTAEEEQTDPLDELAGLAKSAGINVTQHKG